jgi:hypothetical protein
VERLALALMRQAEDEQPSLDFKQIRAQALYHAGKYEEAYRQVRSRFDARGDGGYRSAIRAGADTLASRTRQVPRLALTFSAACLAIHLRQNTFSRARHSIPRYGSNIVRRASAH